MTAYLSHSNQILELLGATDHPKRSEMVTLLTNLVEDRLQNDPRSFETNMTKLLNELGADKISGEIRKDLTEKLCVIVEIESDKVNKDELLSEEGTIKKDYFQWDNYNTPKKFVDKITKDLFTWQSGGYGGRVHELPSKSKSHSTQIFFQRDTKKILFSDHPSFKPNQKLTESDTNEAISQGYSIIPWATDAPDWKRLMMEKINQRRT